MNKITQRDSNMELLRIIAMLLVMFFHIDFISLDGTDPICPSANPISSYLRIVLSLSTFTCVDIFVLLSGWYGIQFKYSKLRSFIFQVLFFSILSYCCFSFFGKTNKKLLLHVFFLDAYWFVPTYLSLYFISPILNNFVKNSNQKTLRRTILFLFIAQSCYGWISPQERGYNEGCSPISFSILYLIARYLKLYPSKLTTTQKKWDLFNYIIICLIASVPVYYGEKYQISIINDTMFKFTSPFTIIPSIYLVLFFSKLKIQSRWINWIAISSFAAFLVHCFPAFNQYVYHHVISYLYNNYHGIIFGILVLAFIFSLYIASIFLDKIRIQLYKMLFRK